MTSVIHNISTRGDPTGSSIWVTSYRLSYSLDNAVWTDVLDPATDDVMSFPGNTDENTPQDNSLPEPVLTRFIKLHPLSYNHHISLRWAVNGCFVGQCISSSITIDHTHLSIKISLLLRYWGCLAC